MDNGNFDQSFMQSVRENAEKQQESQKQIEETRKQRRTIIRMVALALIVVMVVVVVVLLLTRKPDDGGGDVPVDIEEGPASEGTARTYEGDEDGKEGKLYSLRMACEMGDTRYDFYKDRTYEVMTPDKDLPVESGNYVINGKEFALKDEETGKERTITYENGKMTDENAVEYSCEEYDDV